MLRETERAWFSRLLQHPAKKTERVYSYNPGDGTGKLITINSELRNYLHKCDW